MYFSYVFIRILSSAGTVTISGLSKCRKPYKIPKKVYMLLEMETFGIYIKLSNFDYIGPFQYIIWYNIQDKVTQPLKFPIKSRNLQLFLLLNLLYPHYIPCKRFGLFCSCLFPFCQFSFLSPGLHYLSASIIPSEPRFSCICRSIFNN